MGLFRAVSAGVGYLAAPANMRSIRQQWREIQTVAAAIRTPQRDQDDFVVGPEYRIDFEASAQALRERALIAVQVAPFGTKQLASLSTITASELMQVLAARRPRTVRLVWTYSAICAAFIAIWIGGVFGGNSGFTAFLYVLGWLVIVLCFAALVLQALWQNWCLRTARIAPFTAFLQTSDSWLPS